MARGKTVNITPVDDDRGRVTDHPARGQMQVLYDRELFERTIRKERSSAYWFAASLWGMSGLVIGGLMGAYIMFQSMNAAMPVAFDALTRGMAAEQGRQNSERSQPLNLDPQRPQPSNQP